MNILNKQALKLQAAVVAGFLCASTEAQAQSNISITALGTNGGRNDFSDISRNIVDSISDLPALLSGLAYLGGSLLGALGILKIKDHTENPSQTPLKEGAVRLASGGALFALPIVFEAMQTTIGHTPTSVGTSPLKKIDFILAN